jgi:hypothetical protein
MGGRNMKKKVAIVVLALVMAGFMAGNCFAVPVSGTWYVCNVIASGNTGASSLVMLTDSNGTATFSKRWFILNTGTAKQLLAASLTGTAAGLRIYASIPNTTAGSTISNLYVVSDNF